MPVTAVVQDNSAIKPDGRAKGLLSLVFVEVFSYTTLEFFIDGPLDLEPKKIYAPGDELPVRVNKLLEEVDSHDTWYVLLMEACGYLPSSRSLVHECATILHISEEEVRKQAQALQLRRALEHGFPENEEGELREILCTQLNKVNLLTGQYETYEDRLAELVDQARQEDWLADLARTAYLARPYDIALKTFLLNFYQKLPDERPNTGQKVSSGLDALLRIIQNPKMSAVQSILRPHIRDFQMALQLLERLNKYKGLHAQLHTLLTALPTMQYALEKGQGGRPYSGLIRECVRKSRRYASGLPTESNENVWIDTLCWSADQIDRIGQPGAQVVISRVLARLLTVPTEAPRISERIATIAMEIPLVQITDTFAEVQGALVGPGQDTDARIEEFFSGSALLRQLQPWVVKLTQEHFEWQRMERHLQGAEYMDGTTLPDRIPRWENDVRPALMALCGGVKCTAAWAQELIQTIDQLERPQGYITPDAFEKKLDDLQDRASSRFFDVDEELYEVSEELTEIIAPLQRLVQLISN